MQTSKPVAALRALSQSGVHFIVVGGLAAVLDGVPVHTYDLDIVHDRTFDNIDRLLTFLTSIDAIFRIQPERRLRPNISHLSGGGHLNLMTTYGPIDVLATIGNGRDYAALLPHSPLLDIGDGLQVRVLDLETIIAIKEELGTEKDRAVLPLLRRTLDESKKQRGN